MAKKKNMAQLVAEAEAGYDVEAIVRRRAGRPALGSGPSTVESVRLSPELKEQLKCKAEAAGLSVSDAIREALQAYAEAG